MDITPIILLLLFAGFVGFGAKYAVSFLLHIIKPRGQDLDVTVQVKVDADDSQKAMKKAFGTLSKEQKEQVVKVFLTRDDSEGKNDN